MIYVHSHLRTSINQSITIGKSPFSASSRGVTMARVCVVWLLCTYRHGQIRAFKQMCVVWLLCTYRHGQIRAFKQGCVLCGCFAHTGMVRYVPSSTLTSDGFTGAHIICGTS